MRLTLKNYFKQFLHGYISAGHTVWDDSEEEAKRLIDEFVDNNFDDEDCFTYNAMNDFFYHMELSMSEDYQDLYTLYYDENRYRDLLEKYMRRVFNS